MLKLQAAYLSRSKIEPVSSTPAILNDGNTKGWYEGADANITITGAGVSQWNDLSGNGNHLIQTVDANRPTYAGGILTFDGTNDYLVRSTFSYAQPISFYMIFSNITYTSNDEMLRFGSGTNGCVREVSSIGYRLWAGAAFFNGTSGLSLGTYYVHRFIFNGSVAAGSKTIINEGAPTTGTLADFTSTLLEIASSAAPANINVKAVIVRMIIDSDADQLTIIRYLNTKFPTY